MGFPGDRGFKGMGEPYKRRKVWCLKAGWLSLPPSYERGRNSWGEVASGPSVQVLDPKMIRITDAVGSDRTVRLPKFPRLKAFRKAFEVTNLQDEV